MIQSVLTGSSSKSDCGSKRLQIFQDENFLQHMTSSISYIRRQFNLISEMKTKVHS